MKVYTNILANILLALLVKSMNDFPTDSKLQNLKPLEATDELLQVQKLQETILKLLEEIRTNEFKTKEFRDQINELKSKLSDCQEYKKKLLDSEAKCKLSNCEGKLTNIYTIQVPKAFPVPCDSKMAGPGWTVIQRRVDGSENFYRNWNDYRVGFGDLGRNFFLGLDKIHLLTHSQPHELYVHLQDYQKETRYAKYSHFMVGNEASLYELTNLGDYSGTAGDAMSFHINMKFSTPDRDNDISMDHCAEYFKSGWWFWRCLNCSLNGQYDKNIKEHFRGVQWIPWTFNQLEFVQMMIRPTYKKN